MKNKRLLGNALLFFTAMIWGLAFIFQRTGMEHIGAFTFTAGRMIFSSITLLFLSMANDFMQKKKNNLPSQKMSKQALIEYRNITLRGGIYCGIIITFANTLQQLGMIEISAGKAGFMTALYVLLVPPLGFLIFKKKPKIIEIIAVIVGTFGLYLLCIKEEFYLSRYDIYLLLGAVLFAFYILACDFYANKVDVIRLSLLQFTIAAIVMSVVALIFEKPTWQQIRPAMLGIMYCGVFSGGLGYTFQIIGQKYAQPTEASLIMCLESVFSVLFGWLLLKEALTARELTGCIIMFLAIIAVNLPSKNN